MYRNNADLQAWLAKRPSEAALDPDMPIIDPHHQKVTLAPGGGSMRQTAIKVAFLSVTCTFFEASALMDCKVLATQIESKVKANKVNNFKLLVVASDQVGRDIYNAYKVVGSPDLAAPPQQ